LKIVIISYPPCIRRPRSGGSHQNIAIPLGTEKLEWRATWRWKTSEDLCNRLDTIPACDRQTDRQTDILPRHSPRYAYESCGKNETKCTITCNFMSEIPFFLKGETVRTNMTGISFSQQT